MAHPHHHHPHTHGTDQTVGRLWISIVLNLAITLAEVAGGLLSNSLSLLSDALHNLSDTASLGISLGARKISRWRANEVKTFGYNRAEILGAFINLIILILIGVYLIYEGIYRLFHPEPIDGWIMLFIAIVGLIGNFVTAGLLLKSSRDSLNIRSAFMHIVADGLSSVGVVIGGFLVLFYHLYIVDAILTLIIAAYILVYSCRTLRETIDILMESTPGEIDIDKLTDAVSQLPEVLDIHHIHIWRLDENHICMEGHILIPPDELPNLETVKLRIKELLKKRFGIFHSTLEFELDPCLDSEGKPCNESVSKMAVEAGRK